MSQFVLTFTYLSRWLILPPLAFHILLHATVSAMDYTPNVVRKRCFFFVFKHLWAPKRSWKISHGGPWKFWKSPGFFSQWKSGNPANNTGLDVHLSVHIKFFQLGLHGSMPCDSMQGPGHGSLKYAKMANFKVYLLRWYASNQNTNSELWYSKTISKF